MKRKTLLLMTLLSYSTLFAQPKLNMFFVTMPGCHWCEKMEQEIFDNPDMVKKLHREYRIVKLTKGIDPFPAVIQPRYYPTTYVLSEDNTTIVDSLAGYRTPQKFFAFFQDTYTIEMKERNASAEQ